MECQVVNIARIGPITFARESRETTVEDDAAITRFVLGETLEQDRVRRDGHYRVAGDKMSEELRVFAREVSCIAATGGPVLPMSHSKIVIAMLRRRALFAKRFRDFAFFFSDEAFAELLLLLFLSSQARPVGFTAATLELEVCHDHIVEGTDHFAEADRVR